MNHDQFSDDFDSTLPTLIVESDMPQNACHADVPSQHVHLDASTDMGLN